MRLHIREFRVMNSFARRFVLKNLEFKTFRKFGFDVSGKDVLEIGCGSGYGASLISSLNPKSYFGVDLMKEQIQLSKKRRLKNCTFIELDAADLSVFPDKSKDIVVIFGILHHVPEWRKVLKECYRILKVGGEIYVQEPCKRFIIIWDFFFRWHHPQEALFSLFEFEGHLRKTGFLILNRRNFAGMGIYQARK